MDALIDLFVAQLSDVFRIGLLVALVFTTANTAAQTGRVIPLVLGAIFVAVLIPTTLAAGEQDLATAIGVGLVSNAVILAILLGLQFLWMRFGPRGRG